MKEKLRQEHFLTVVKTNADAFYRYAYSVLQNKQDAEDAVSEMILKAFSHLSDLRQLSKMRSWMFQILANTCRTMAAKQVPASNADTMQIPVHAEPEPCTDLYDYICHMEPAFREVVILYYYEGLKVREISDILRISQGTVKSRLSRAREKLKAYLESC